MNVKSLLSALALASWAVGQTCIAAPAAAPAPDTRFYEMRTYTAAPDKLDDLNKRFRDHTVALFANHGIANIGYWVPADKDKGSDNTLIYLIAHKDKDSAAKSWKDFGADPAWVAARRASE